MLVHFAVDPPRRSQTQNRVVSGMEVTPGPMHASRSRSSCRRWPRRTEKVFLHDPVLLVLRVTWMACLVLSGYLLFGVVSQPVRPGFSRAPVVTYAHLVRRWTAFGNDQLPDCTVAAEATLVEVWDAIEGRPADLQRLSVAVNRRWRALSRYEPSVPIATAYWYDHAFLGAQPADLRTFSVRNRRLLESAALELGAVEITMTLPSGYRHPPSDAGSWPPTLWTTATFGDRYSNVGHAAVVTGYGRTGVVLVTWGQVVDVTWTWLARFGYQATAILPSIYVRLGHGPVGSLSRIAGTVFRASSR